MRTCNACKYVDNQTQLFDIQPVPLWQLGNGSLLAWIDKPYCSRNRIDNTALLPVITWAWIYHQSILPSLPLPRNSLLPL